MIPANAKANLLELADVAGRARTEIDKAVAAGNDTMRLMVTAEATRQMTELLDDAAMAPIMALQGTPQGFTTDKDDVYAFFEENGKKVRRSGYSIDTVRNVTVQAFLRGALMIGGETTIIGGKGYFGKATLEREILELPEMTEFEGPFAGDMEMISDRTAAVEMWARWRYRGTKDALESRKVIREGTNYDERIRVRVNKGMELDGIIGKAKKKFYDRVKSRILGKPVAEEDDAPLDAEYTVTTTPARTPEEEALRFEVSLREAYDDCASQKACFAFHAGNKKDANLTPDQIKLSEKLRDIRVNELKRAAAADRDRQQAFA